MQRNEKIATEYYKLAAAQGHAEARYNYGNALFFGREVPIDQTEATRWFRLSAMQGYPAAQYSYGFAFSYGGRGVAQDAEVRAVRPGLLLRRHLSEKALEEA